MKCLTLHQPWAYAVARLSKVVENRSWHPSVDVLGQYIAIHAGKQWDPALKRIRPGRVFQCPSGLMIPRDGHVYGVVVAVARLTAYASDARTLVHLVGPDGLCWWIPGQVGWVLSDVHALSNPVPCRGHHRLWTLPDDVETLVRVQLGPLVGSPERPVIGG